MSETVTEFNWVPIDDLSNPLSRPLPKPVRKHYPGGQDHDQSKHGRRGNPRQLGPNPGQTTTRLHESPLFHVMYGTSTLKYGYKPLRLPDGSLARLTLDDALAAAGEKGAAKFLETVQTKFDLYNIEPDKIEPRLQMVLDSALTRYELMNAAGEAGEWHEADELPEWITDLTVEIDRAEAKTWRGETPSFIAEIHAEIDDLVEYGDDGQWRWKENAGDTLADLDDFYDNFHRTTLEVSRETGYGFDQGAAVVSQISPQHKAIPNLVTAVDMMQLTAADDVITGIVKEKTIIELQARLDTLSKKAKPNKQQVIDIAESKESLALLSSGDRRPSELPVMGHLFGINEQRRLLVPTGAGFQAPTGWTNFTKALSVLRGDIPADMLTGLKRRSFANNIMDPTDIGNRLDTTIDFHIMNAGNLMLGADNVSQLTGGKVNGIDIGVRAHYAQALVDITGKMKGRHPLLRAPLDAQQIIWAEWQRGGDTKALTWTDVSGESHPLQKIGSDIKNRIEIERAS